MFTGPKFNRGYEAAHKVIFQVAMACLLAEMVEPREQGDAPPPPQILLKEVAFIAGKSENQADKKNLFVFPLII